MNFSLDIPKGSLWEKKKKEKIQGLSIIPIETKRVNKWVNRNQ